MASAPMAGGRFITIGGDGAPGKLRLASGGAFRIAHDKAFHDIGRKPEGEMRPRGHRSAWLKGHGPAT